MLLADVLKCNFDLFSGIRDIPFISVIIVQLRRRTRVPTATENETAGETNTQEAVSETTTTSPSSEPVTVASADSDKDVSDDSKTTANISQTPESQQTSISEHLTSRQNEQGDNFVEAQHLQAESVVSENDAELVSDRESSVDDILSKSELRHRRLEYLAETIGPAINSESEANHDNEVPQNATESVPNTASENITQASVETVSAHVPDQNTIPAPGAPSTRISETFSPSVNRTTQNESGQTPTSDEDTTTLPGEIRVKIKFLNETMRLVSSPETETIGNFRRYICPSM